MTVNTYTCLECGGEFETPVPHTERHGLDALPYETYPSCPFCGSGAYTQTHVCDECFRPIIGQYVRLKTGEDYCEDCFEFREI